MQIGEYAGAATSEEDFITCTEVRGEKGGRRCECPSREPVPDEPIWEGEWTEEQIPAMKRAIIRHYEASAFNVCRLQPQPKMGELPPVKLWVDEQKYVPRKITQASQVPIHLQEAAKASIQ